MSKKKVLADYILGVDHIAIPVRNIKFWIHEYIKVQGGKLFHETPDANPDGKSSMHLCGILLGGVSIALIQGIDREEKSQVTKFVELHGDHSFQHIAIRVSNIKQFVRLAQKNGYQFLSEIHQRADSFGPVRQIFACRFDPSVSKDAAAFYEFVERPPEGKSNFNTAGKSFSNEFAKALYKDVESAPEAIFVNLTMRIEDCSRTL